MEGPPPPLSDATAGREPARPAAPATERTAAPHPPAWTKNVVRWPVALGLVLAVLIVAVLFVAARDGDDEGSASPTTTAAALTVPSSGGATTSSVVASTEAPGTIVTAPSTTVAATTTAPITTAPPTTAAPATAAPTTTSAPPTTVPPATEPAVTTPADPRTITLDARREACPFGPSCLVVGFTISGFPRQPTEFTCIFGNGGRFTYDLGRLRTVDPACRTGNETDTITVEIDGVRSETVSTRDV